MLWIAWTLYGLWNFITLGGMLCYGLVFAVTLVPFLVVFAFGAPARAARVSREVAEIDARRRELHLLAEAARR